MGNFYVWDYRGIRHDKLAKLHICSYFPDKNLSFDLSRCYKKNPKVFWKTETGKLRTYGLYFVTVWSHKYLLYFTLCSWFLVISGVFVLRQENLQWARLVCYSVHAVNF